MQNQVVNTFNFAGLSEIRTLNDASGVLLFVAKDVADALGYTDTVNAIKRHCKGVAQTYPLSTAGGLQEVRVITEPDMYRLVFGSELKSAVKFQDWVTSEVLPSIRRTGQYTLQDHPDVLEAMRTKIEALETKYGKPAHEIKPPFLGQSYLTPLQWHSVMYVMHTIADLSSNPRVALDTIVRDYHKYRDGHVSSYSHTLTYLEDIRTKYESGFDPVLGPTF